MNDKILKNIKIKTIRSGIQNDKTSFTLILTEEGDVFFFGEQNFLILKKIECSIFKKVNIEKKIEDICCGRDYFALYYQENVFFYKIDSSVVENFEELFKKYSIINTK
jgi:hypothetical protein